MSPSHPGPFFYEHFVEDLNFSISDVAKMLGVSRKQLSEVINEKASISTEMAARMEKVFRTEAEVWLKIQMDYDLWHFRKSGKLDHLQKFTRRKAKTPAR